MLIKTFQLVNEDKVNRALNGTPKGSGEAIGGVGNGAYLDGSVWKRNGDELSETEVDALENALLAEYDKLGGLIKRGKDVVKTGSFFDFKAKRPQAKPRIVFVYRINGKYVEVADGVELPGEVKAQRIIDEMAAEESSDDSDGEVKETRRGRKGKK